MGCGSDLGVVLGVGGLGVVRAGGGGGIKG